MKAQLTDEQTLLANAYVRTGPRAFPAGRVTAAVDALDVARLALVGMLTLLTGISQQTAHTANEEALFPRNEQVHTDAQEILELCLGEDPPHGLIDLFNFNRAAQGQSASQRQS